MMGLICDYIYFYILIVFNYCNINIYVLVVKVNNQIEFNVNLRDKF